MTKHKESVKKYYDHWAESWDERYKGSKSFRFFLDKRVEMIRENLGEFDTLLDAGCGTGYYIMRLLKPGQTGLGIDISEQMLAKAASIKEERFPNLSIDFKVEDGEHLTLPSDSFDRVIHIGYIVHLEDQQQAMDELYRVLKPSGRAVGLISNSWSPWMVLRLRRLFNKDYGVLSSDRELSPLGVRSMMAKAGFKNVKLVIFNTLPGNLPDWSYYPARLLNLIFSVWPISLLGFHILAIGDKD